MVNGNYVLYGDRPSSESEIVDDHVHTRTAERKNKRKSNRNANELQRTLNMAQIDNETDSAKYEKTREPRLLRYVSTTDVQENFVTEKFETYDLKPTEERPRRYAFQKKTRNPTDGSVNYAYSRSSSNCSSPNGNLPTISEHGEQYGTFRVQPLPRAAMTEIISGYEKKKLDKYFSKPKDAKMFSAKVNYEGSHPDSLYRVPASNGGGVDKLARVVRVLRWPVVLVAVCIALAAFVYFLMPDNLESDLDIVNGTYWEPVTAGAHLHSHPAQGHRLHTHKKKPESTNTHTHGTKTPEIDFYDAESDKNIDVPSIIDAITETSPQRVLPIKPVFPSHVTPEVQYGNERVDSEKPRIAKILDEANTLPEDSTLKPHITQKPEKPLAVYFKDTNAAATTTTTTTETITRAETVNEFTNYGDKQTTRKNEEIKSRPSTYKEQPAPAQKAYTKQPNIQQYLLPEPDASPEEPERYYGRHEPTNVNFTSGHSKLFGISIEDAEKMSSTTQNSLYNTRVSPTLPTWRDGDDTTTKKYPVNVNYEVPQCRSTWIPLCRGVLPYDLAGAPATIGGVEATALLPQIDYLVATNCSDRVRHLTCALLEPECNPPPYPAKMPCYNLCKAIVDSCDGLIPRELTPAFNCQQYSHHNCVAAKAPCYNREFTCGDGSCLPRDWICDGTKDCPGGEDEAQCLSCERNEFRCASGGCILKRWLCDGYADCPQGEDEAEGCDRHVPGEPGEESAGSAPAPAVRRPNRLPVAARTGDLHRTGEADNSKELLVTSDSNNAFKRNFTRRPSLSRLTPYTRANIPMNAKTEFESTRKSAKSEVAKATQKPEENNESAEDVNIGDLGFFEELKKTTKEQEDKNNEQKPTAMPKVMLGRAPPPLAPIKPTRIDKSMNKLETVIDGAALLKKAQEEEDAIYSSETNTTSIERNDDPPPPVPTKMGSGPTRGAKSAHASPCPSGELRCVDGRCITLAQLCDGTIDCTDHADEDNCYT